MPAVRKADADDTDTGEWISLSATARLLGEVRPTVLHRCVKGQLVAKHIAGRTIISRESVEKLLAMRGVSG